MFQFLQPLAIGGLQAAVLGFPLVVGGGADAVAPPDRIDGPAGIGLLQNRHHLGLSELRLAQGNLLARVAIVPEGSPYGPSQIGGSLRFRRHIRRGV